MNKPSYLPLTLLFASLFLLSLALPAAAQQTLRHYLSGTDKDRTVAWDFFVTKGRKSGSWDKIPVPSNWEQHGFGTYNYGRGEKLAEEQGLYKHTFRAEPAWQGQRVNLVFEGSMTDTEVKVNGKPAGPIHQGSFYRFQYDISNLLNYGADNLLEVTVSKMSANKSVNEAEREADFWVFGGIFRPVYLEVKPASHVERIAVDARADGSFLVEVYPINTRANQTVEAQVQTLKGENVGRPFSVKVAARQEKAVLRQQIPDPALWNAETPNLYQVVVSLKDDKNTVHTLTEKFGFRTVEVRPRDGIYVNGSRVILKGVNRHSAWPESGRTLSRELSVLDVQLMKDMNMNAVRMSHYPPDKHFLEVCDSLGLYVLDELTGWQAAYDIEVGRKLVKELVIRDVNHPSILFWDNGNEGGWNTALDGDYALYDPQQRVVLHPWERFGDFETKHYINYNYLVNHSLYGQEILLPTEFMHGLHDGGHAAGLDDFWELMRRSPHAAGAFLWVFADEGIKRTDTGKIDIKGNQAPDGIVGPYREKEGSFFAIKEIWSPVHIGQRVITPAFDGRLPVENRYDFTNLDQVSFAWKLVSFPGPADSGTAARENATGQPRPFALAPGEKSFLPLGLPQNWQQSDALYLTATDPHGRELYTWSWALKTPREVLKPTLPVARRAAVRATEQGNSLIVNADGVRFHFDKATGQIQQVVNAKGKISLSNGPVLAGVAHTLKKLSHRKEGNTYVVEAQYEGGSYFQVKWTFAPGQPAKLDYAYKMKDESDFMGITFNYPEENVTGMKWLGRGPYRVWKNRTKGQQFGLWQKAYNNTVTGESWQYPEFKGYHSELHWVQVQTKEAPFTVYTDNTGIFLQMLRPQKPAGASNDHTHPPFPQGNLGFLHGISPIGTKFQDASEMGPESQKNIMMNYTPLSATLWFDFR